MVMVIWHNKHCVSMKCCNSFSPNQIIRIILKIVNELVNGRQMWLHMLVAIRNVEQINVSNAKASIAIKMISLSGL